MIEETTSSLAPVAAAYQGRVDALEAANKANTEAAKPVSDDADAAQVIPAEDWDGDGLKEDDLEITDEAEPAPDMSWKKDDIIDYLIVKSDDEVDREELEVLTKTQLLERVTDTEG